MQRAKLELHELSSEELNAASGGVNQQQLQQQEATKQSEALKGFEQALQELP